ncbi:MAG: ATP-dependent DNA helicase [Pseudomonadota bacterium]|nr:ATP-dependent DNA helicase [Pseudomonadota bacterium]
MAASLPYPALHATHAGICIAHQDGRVEAIGRGAAIARAAETPTILLNAPLVGSRLGYPDLSGLDLLELFAFVRPARFAVPTPKGIANALGLQPPPSDAEAAAFLREAAAALLATLERDWPERQGAWASAQALHRLRWPWSPAVGQRLRRPDRDEPWLFSRLPEWQERPPRTQPRPVRVGQPEAIERLALLVGPHAEARQGQRDYCGAVVEAFAPRPAEGLPNLVLAEAGTGIGKTLGYLAPASLWAASAGGAVWLSTYTKALQRQLDRESGRLFPDAEERKAKVVIRKGRENYLCLLNLEDALQGGFSGRAAVLAQLVARWAAYTRDGDMVGGDLPGWLPSLFRRAGAAALTDRRGECVYAGCPHHRKCFIERAAQASKHADLVVANHALVMVNAARGRHGGEPPARIVFDEGHHLFEAADSTFAAALTGQELIELRRWIVGPEARSRGRRRGLAARLMDVGSYDEAGAAALEAAVAMARALPADGWLQRLAEGTPFGPLEKLLGAVRATVYARATAQDAGYGLETEMAELDPQLVETAAPAVEALELLHRPLIALGKRLEAVVEDAPDWLDAQARARVEGALGGLSWRAQALQAWIALAARVGGPADPDFVDWLAVERVDGREFDVGLHRRWLDPTRPLAETVLKPAHGLVITSATLRGGGEWEAADARTGASHLGRPPTRFAAPSPFAYAEQSEVLVVTDVKKGDLPALAGAYARLIEAAEGGTLGLFTAIQRLKAVHARVADRLARAGLPLYAQHVDPIDTGTLVDIFRDDPRASLLGTDALRDGVDVPGDSLRLVVMEGVPWPRPTVLHAARRAAGGGSAYDERVVRGRLAQAFGRLIRKADDRGAFVLLSAATPTRLLTGFPPGVPIRRLPLAEAVERVRARFSTAPALRHQPMSDSLADEAR